MSKKTIEIEDRDRQDLRLCFQTINMARDMIDKNPGFSLLTEDQLRDYLSGLCDVLIGARITLHSLRKEIAKKYNIDYNFMFDGENIILLG